MFAIFDPRFPILESRKPLGSQCFSHDSVIESFFLSISCVSCAVFAVSKKMLMQLSCSSG
jgi:hypothetical protein